MLELYYSVYFIFGISVLAILIVWNSNLHKNPKFSTILQLITALTILFTSFAIIIQLFTFNSTQSDTEIKLYQSLFDDLLGGTITYFENNPKMIYFYNQMFRPLHYNVDTPIYKRNYSNEQQIVHFILQKTASIVYLLDNDKVMSMEDKEIVKEKLKLFYKNIIRSPIFIENYNNIKPQIFNIQLRNYLQENYNI
jgi:hypothetical protein